MHTETLDWKASLRERVDATAAHGALSGSRLSRVALAATAILEPQVIFSCAHVVFCMHYMYLCKMEQKSSMIVP